MPELGVGDIAGFLRSHGPFEEPSLLATGEKVGDWKVLAFLGRGGSAEVYRAENEVTGIVGALKVLYASDERALVRFRREAQLLAESKSPAFPKFYGAGASGGRCYIAEELLEPQELPCGDVMVARFMLDVAAGVGELHRRGFVHRDIKPRNVMVRPSTGESVLIDMGLAPGRELGIVLDELLTEVLEEPQLNEREVLLERAASFAAFGTKNKYKKLFFDLDGTLTNSEEGIVRCHEYALRTLGVPE